jgi:hypothetical protein
MSNEHQIVEALCNAYGSSIENVCIRALRHFYELHELELPTIRQATKASLINDYIYQYFQEEFEKDSSFFLLKNPNGDLLSMTISC